MSGRSGTTDRRWAAPLLVAIVAALASLFMLAPAASAAGAPVAQTSAPYPPVFCPTIAISTTHPFPGQSITITGTGFHAAQALTLVMTPGPYTLGHVTTTAAGTFSTQVTLPAGVTGHRVIRADGAGSDCPVDPIQIDVNSTPPPSPNPPLPFTGVDVLTALAIALALVGIGLLLSRSGRRTYRGAHGRR